MHYLTLPLNFYTLKFISYHILNFYYNYLLGYFLRNVLASQKILRLINKWKYKHNFLRKSLCPLPQSTKLNVMHGSDNEHQCNNNTTILFNNTFLLICLSIKNKLQVFAGK